MQKKKLKFLFPLFGHQGGNASCVPKYFLTHDLKTGPIEQGGSKGGGCPHIQFYSPVDLKALPVDCQNFIARAHSSNGLLFVFVFFKVFFAKTIFATLWIKLFDVVLGPYAF